MINENNVLELNEDELGPNDIEVDFDDVHWNSNPFNGFSPVKGPLVFGTLDPGTKNEEHSLDFSVAGKGKGKKRVFLAGLGQSLHHRIKNLASDPFLVIEKDGRAIARSDSWMLEKNANEFEKAANQVGLPLAPTDAGVILELEPGNYTARVSAPGERDVYAGLRLIDLDPNSKETLRYSSEPARELKAMWNGKSTAKK